MEDKKYAIEVKDLKIRYRCLNKMSIKQSLFKLKKSNMEIFEAVRGISFNVPKGEIMGIVGKNGSGKSTLLRAIAGIFAPDEGSIDLHGHTVSLLSIGVGFQKKLTGRENILLSGMLLGFSEEEIRERMPDIIHHSYLETEIMLVDEVLSVGDAKFKKKSFKKMKQLINDKDRTVVIVSHNGDTLRKLCDTILWLHDGVIKMQGSTKEVLPLYEEFMS